MVLVIRYRSILFCYIGDPDVIIACVCVVGLCAAQTVACRGGTSVVHVCMYVGCSRLYHGDVGKLDKRGTVGKGKFVYNL